VISCPAIAIRTTFMVLRTILRRVGRAFGKVGSAPDTGDLRQVRPLTGARRSPLTPEECLIVRELGGAEPRAVDDLVAIVSRTLYREDWRRGGWIVDIGIFGPNLFAPDVVRALEAGNGQLWTITQRPPRTDDGAARVVATEPGGE
jgi:hypothetical protein